MKALIEFFQSLIFHTLTHNLHFQQCALFKLGIKALVETTTSFFPKLFSVSFNPLCKPILALPTWGQTCFNSDSEPFEITDFDLGHPVHSNVLVGNTGDG